MHEGHRERMFERLESGAKLEDHEILEMLLYAFLPRINTNEIAHSLIQSFDGFSNVFSASIDQLMEVKGVGKRTARGLALIGLANSRLKDPRPCGIPHAFSYESFAKYLFERHRNDAQEYLEIYIVKSTGELAFCKQFTSDDPFKVSIPAEQLVSFVSDFDPKEVIVVHNHVDGNCLPSDEDDLFTKKLFLYLDLCNVKLQDHFIVSSRNVFSYRHEGRMKEICEKCNANSVLKNL